jgi:hypothetical protein
MKRCTETWIRKKRENGRLVEIILEKELLLATFVLDMSCVFVVAVGKWKRVD